MGLFCSERPATTPSALATVITIMSKMKTYSCFVLSYNVLIHANLHIKRVACF